MRAAMTLLSTLHTSCFLSGDKPLTLLNIATMVRLSLTHGNVEESAYAYVLHAAMLSAPSRRTIAPPTSLASWPYASTSGSTIQRYGPRCA